MRNILTHGQNKKDLTRLLGNEKSAKEKQVQQQTKKKHRDVAGLE